MDVLEIRNTSYVTEKKNEYRMQVLQQIATSFNLDLKKYIESNSTPLWNISHLINCFYFVDCFSGKKLRFKKNSTFGCKVFLYTVCVFYL